MIPSDRVELDGKKRKLLLQGSCLELGSLCAAACCREWRVDLSFAEFQSDLYHSEQMCILTDKTCDKPAAACIHRAYQLKRNTDGACAHLDAANQCSIYENRPTVCRDFSCQGGWRLGSVFPIDGNGNPATLKPDKEAWLSCVTDEMVFVPHPLIKLHAVFCLPAKAEIILVMERVGACVKYNTRDQFAFPQLDDDRMLALIRSFDRKESLDKIRQQFCTQHRVNLTPGEFNEIIWLLNKHNLILDAKNFRGMLAGMGDV
jgi:hypothetical protein